MSIFDQNTRPDEGAAIEAAGVAGPGFKGDFDYEAIQKLRESEDFVALRAQVKQAALDNGST